MGDRRGERGPIGEEGATAGELGMTSGEGDGGARGDEGAPSTGTGGSKLRATGEGDGGSECSRSTDVCDVTEA